ncbi:hypothetical protein OLX02_04585 [Novosphingobium sp. KCTC 2891]|uniref:hypothetical protein n=1 Tax=Novosphingobium sp. KCTC 2891 TaxID=2989730 RepID=UPI0022236475|nr:hypothetical protein [Novosphingobium sp. KCTC 2891]MCW1382091.1 hypothetical protein [Novosphingobium sp. KCTC 2891]
MRGAEVLLMLGVAGLALGTCWCLYRATVLFAGWQRAVAHVTRGGYSDTERLDDFFHLQQSFGTIRGWNWRDGEGKRWIEDEVLFETAEGHTQRAIVGRQVTRSWKPSSVFAIWYDRANPARVTAYGAYYWTAMAVLSLALLYAVFAWGIDWARTGRPPQWLESIADEDEAHPQLVWERVADLVSHK